MRIILGAVITGVSAAFTGDLFHSATAGFVALVAISAGFITLAVRGRRRAAAA